MPGWASGLPAYCTGRAAGAEIQQLRARSKLPGGWLLGASVTLLAAMAAAFAASGRAGTSREGWPERAGLTGAGAILAVLAFVVTAAAVLRLAWSGLLRRADPRPARMPGRTCHVLPGPIGSGEAVIAHKDSEIRQYLTHFNDKTLALETEAGGVAEAFYETAATADPGTGWLALRGISDHADTAKDDSYHEIASWHAAAILQQLLRYLKPCGDGASPASGIEHGRVRR